MPVSFLNPALLLGTVMASLPVILHFLSRRRVRKIPFSDLRFLDQTQASQSRRLGMRRWLLLLLRVLAILCVALAAAGPMWGGMGAAGGSARSVIFIIDQSASMSTQTENGSRFGDAVRQCEEMINALPGEASVQVLLAGSQCTPLFGDWLPAGSVDKISSANVTHGSLDMEALIAAVDHQVVRAPVFPIEVVFLSDLQVMAEVPDLRVAVEKLENAVGQVHFLVHKVGESQIGGGVVATHLPARMLRPTEGITLVSDVIPGQEEEVFTLLLDGKAVAEAVTEGTPGSLEQITFALTAPGPGFHRGQVIKTSDSFTADDSRPFILNVPSSMGILLVHGRDRAVDPTGGRGGWRYLYEALNPGQEGGLFRVKSVSSDDFAAGDLAAYRVVIFVDPDPLGRRGLTGLTQWLGNGGTALFMVGEPSLATYLGGALLPALGLPGDVQWRSQTGEGLRVKVIDHNHPVFTGLQEDAVGTFEDIQWKSWFELSEGKGRVLLSVAGGDPLMISSMVDDGMVVILPFDLRPASTSLAGSPMALPFFQRLVGWMAGHGQGTGAVNSEVGQYAQVFVDPARKAELAAVENLFMVSDGSDDRQAVSVSWPHGRPMLQGGLITEVGTMSFLAGRDTLAQVAAGTPGAESEIRLHAGARWIETMGSAGLTVAGDISSLPPSSFFEVLSGRPLAPWLLGLALVLLLIEQTVGRGVGAGRKP
jgi:hypothetical protein